MSAFATDAPKFEKWLVSRGCEILPATNPYEVLRFKGKEVGVLYSTGKTSGKYANDAYVAFKLKRKWKGAPDNTVRKGIYYKEKIALIERDGRNCFYCGMPLCEDITVEHLMSLNSGGSNTLGNMVLAHLKCNHEAGVMTISEKVKHAIKNRLTNPVT